MDAIAKASPFDDLPPDFPGQYLRLRCHLFYNPGKFVHLQIVDAEGNPLKQPALAKQEDNDEAGSQNSMPRILHQTSPEYTDKARRAKVNGVVVLKLTVNEAGDVSHARVVKGLGYGLDENAVRAVQSWKFKPAMKDGAPIEKEIAVEVSFRVY